MLPALIGAGLYARKRGWIGGEGGEETEASDRMRRNRHLYTVVPPGQGLGYAPETLTAMTQGNTADLAGAKMSVTDMYNQPGGPGLGSGEYLSAISGLENANVAQGGARLRTALTEDERLRREDFQTRFAALSGYLSTLIGARGRYAAGNTRTQTKGHSLTGEVYGSYGK